MTNSVNFHLCPPNYHRTNQAYKAINTWKYHFLARLSGVDPNFPLHLWCRLIPQATQTLNLLHRSRINSRLSAEAQLNGALDYNQTPMEPPSKKVLIHKTLQQRRTWYFHGNGSWYIGTAPLHYRCYRIYIPDTREDRITKTVQFFFYNGAMPAMSSVDTSTDAARRIADALENRAPAAPFTRFGA